MQGARCAWFVRARHVPDALAKIGLVGPADRLVVRANDFTDAFRAAFGAGCLSFARDVTPEAFLDATRACPHPAAGGPREGHASYADGAGAGYDRLFWFVNSIGCFGLRVADLRGLADAARDAGAILIVDNTVASAWGCLPLEAGAHVVCEGLDRVAAGELAERAVGIAVARDARGRGRRRVADPLAADAYRMLAQRLGGERAQPSFDVSCRDLDALARGFATLPARMQRHDDNARAIAEYLAANPYVPSVAYPGLPSHPDHEVAARTLRHGFGPAVDFELPHGLSARGLIAACPASYRSGRAGGPTTRLSAPRGDEARFIRLFAGVDDPLEIVDSLDQAMRLSCDPPQP